MVVFESEDVANGVIERIRGMALTGRSTTSKCARSWPTRERVCSGFCGAVGVPR
jgi:hypothetical protein